MTPADRTALGWAGTIVTWLTAPIGGGAAALFAWLCFWLTLGLLFGNGTLTRQGLTLIAQSGAIGIVRCAAVWGVFFLHPGGLSRTIHFVGCNVFALIGLPAAGIAMLAIG